MERTTIMLPHDLKVKAANRANILGISLGKFIRESISNALENDHNQTTEDDPLFKEDDIFCGETPIDLAQRHDHYLYGDKE